MMIKRNEESGSQKKDVGIDTSRTKKRATKNYWKGGTKSHEHKKPERGRLEQQNTIENSHRTTSVDRRFKPIQTKLNRMPLVCANVIATKGHLY